jgi:hypothetical protein
VQQRVGCAEPRFPDEPRKQGQGRGLLRTARHRRQHGERYDEHHRAIEPHHRSQREHENEAEQVAGEQDAATRIAVGDRAADRAQQDVGKEASNGCGAYPGGRAVALYT